MADVTELTPEEVREYRAIARAFKARPEVRVPRFLLRAEEAAQTLGLSRSFFLSLDRSGRVPRAVQIGRCKRWIAEELAAWARSRCVPRGAWEEARAVRDSMEVAT